MKRCGGVLMHISSVPGNYMIGTLGKGAYDFVDFLSESGFGVWQVLPVGPCDEYNSPYSGRSAFAGNYLFIDPEILFERGLLTKDELDMCRSDNIYTTLYDELKETRKALFRKAFARLNDEERERVTQFVKENPWSEKYALFCALKAENGGKPWIEWEKSLRFRKCAAIKEAEQRLSEEIFFNEFLQCEFFSQWKKLKDYANSKGIGIIGDMPLYLSHDSADVWFNPEMFLLDEDLCVKNCAGVPPDYFCSDGQKWGNPLYNWENMKKDGYSLWLSRIGHALNMYDAVRIDHFRGFSAFWSIPAEESAKDGHWEKGPGMDLFSRVKTTYKGAEIIAEDLGDIDEDVIKLVKETGFPGMGVMQFAFISGEDNPHLPHNYTKNTVAYTGTHDNTTILGWLWESNETARGYALDYCGFTGDWGEGGAHSAPIRSIIRTLWRSGAICTIVPVQDLCGFGGDTCMNHPGTAEGNWSFRLTNQALASIDRDFYKSLNSLYKRGKFIR